MTPGSATSLKDISGSLITYTLPGDYLALNDVYDIDSFGPEIVYVDLYGEHGGIGQTVWIIDLTTGQRKALNEPEPHVGTLGPRIAADDVVWSAVEPDGNGRLRWRIMHHVISTGLTNVIDQGINTRIEDGSPSGPATAIDDNSVAYTIEAPTAASPFGWKIVVRRLSDGSLEREIQTRYTVWDLAIQNGNVLYEEVPPEESGNTLGGVMLSTVVNSEPIQVADNGGGLAIDGERIVWDGMSKFVLNSPVTDQGVFTATFDDFTPILITQPSGDEGGARYSAAGDGLVTWTEPSPAWDNLFVWDSRTSRTYQVSGQDSTLSNRHGTFLPNIAGGWLTWEATLATDTQTLAEFAGLRTDDVRAAEPAS